MANTYSIISSQSVGAGGAASISFTSIPATYTDLLIKVSSRMNTANPYTTYFLSFNGSTSDRSMNWIWANGSGTYATSGGSNIFIYGNGNTTSNFSNGDIYISNYASAVPKTILIDNVVDGGGSGNQMLSFMTALWNNTSTISSLELTGAYDFLQYTTATLYGIKKS